MTKRLKVGFVLVGLAFAGVLGGCSDSSAAAPDSGSANDATVDAALGDAGTANSVCGYAGELGNEAGIGQYCPTLGTCPTGAPLCSSINNATVPLQSFFCTRLCNACSPAGFCGAGAACVCETGFCTCVPDSCPALFPDGGNPPCTEAGVSDAAESGTDSALGDGPSDSGSGG